MDGEEGVSLSISIHWWSMTQQEIYDLMVECSGPHKEFKDNTNRIRDGKDLYSSFHWPEFSFTNSLRNTQTRFKEFGISDLSGKSVLDLGSNIGGISFEALRLNASLVFGFEYVQERVDVCCSLANFLNKKNAIFKQLDLNKMINDDLHKRHFINLYQSDVVFCTAIDAYIGSKFKLYQLLFDITKEVCYFETNSNQNSKDLTSLFMDLGFVEVTCLGTSRSDSGYGRCSYVLRKAKEIIRNRDIKCEEFSHRNLVSNTHFIQIYKNPLVYNKMKLLTRRLKENNLVIHMDFCDILTVKTPKHGLSLFDLKNDLTPNDKLRIKSQIIQLVKAIHAANLAHMDIHVKNVVYNGEIIKIIDWEFVEICDAKLENHYDLTGRGIENGFPSSLGQHILRENDSFSILEFLKPMSLSIKDFL